jgi:hypothetical protein
VASKAADLGSLLEGQASAYVHVHSAAMLELVTSSHTVVPEVVRDAIRLHRTGTRPPSPRSR